MARGWAGGCAEVVSVGTIFWACPGERGTDACQCMTLNGLLLRNLQLLSFSRRSIPASNQVQLPRYVSLCSGSPPHPWSLLSIVKTILRQGLASVRGTPSTENISSSSLGLYGVLSGRGGLKVSFHRLGFALYGDCERPTGAVRICDGSKLSS